MTTNQTKPSAKLQSTPQLSKTRQRSSPQAMQQNKKAETGPAHSLLSGSPVAANAQGTMAATSAAPRLAGKATPTARALEGNFTGAELCSFENSMDVETEPASWKDLLIVLLMKSKEMRDYTDTRAICLVSVMNSEHCTKS